jgi:hypothetical protein
VVHLVLACPNANIYTEEKNNFFVDEFFKKDRIKTEIEFVVLMNYGAMLFFL